MFKVTLNYVAVFLILNLSLVCNSVYATVEDEIVELTERAHDIKADKQKFKGTWLPVPIPISNPTIGSGLQAAILYLHPKNTDNSDVPDTTSGIGAMYTDTESWFVGGFHDGNWKEDLYRYRLAGGTAEFNLDFYGIGDNSPLRNKSVPFTISSDFLFGQLLREIPGTRDWYLGLRYVYSNSNVKFNILDNKIPSNGNNLTTSSVGLLSNYDSRDNNYYPTTGQYFEIAWASDDESYGSDFDFNKLTSFYNYYLPLGKNDVIATQARYATVSGDAPFYLIPFLQMRGFAAGKYKNDVTLSGHLEWRHIFHPRWGFVTFYEVGSTANTTSELFDLQKIKSYGVGIRWQVTADKKLNLGVDIAKSGDDDAIYVQIGERY